MSELTPVVSVHTHHEFLAASFQRHLGGNSTAVLPGVIIRFPKKAALPLYFMQRWWVALLVWVSVGLAIAVVAHPRTEPATLVIRVDHDSLPADGYAQAHLEARASDGSRVPKVTWQLENGASLVVLETSDAGVTLRAGVSPGRVVLVAAAPGFHSARLNMNLLLDPTDQFDDGTPDFFRLQDEGDQLAFRRWFAFLAEGAYFEKEEDRPVEVKDCAALIRFAYREAIRHHDGPWATQWRLPSLPDAASVRKYEYPHTALGAALFRTRPGAFTTQDIGSGAFAEFADAKSLWRFNTHFVSRDLSAARAGDLLFFRQAEHRMPFHTMIYLGRSFFSEGADWVVYHTGPSGKRAGEIRRVTIRDLLRHPEANWRPLPQNPAFMGVYRWNILREED